MLKVGDVVKIADWTHLHLPKEWHGRLEVVAIRGLVVVSPLPSKKATSFHADDVFSAQYWISPSNLTKLKKV